MTTLITAAKVIDYKNVTGFLNIPNIFSFTGSQLTKIRKYSITQLQNRFSQQPIGISKKPQNFCSLSPTD